MNKLYRNIALVTGVFMLAMSAMLIVNYFQVSAASPLENEVLEALKALNEQGGDNAALQSQIRELDLLARKAYFVRQSQLESGVVILVAMALVTLFCARMYFRRAMDLPDKEMDVMDEWLSKSSSRRYVTWGCAALVVAAVVAALVTRGEFSKRGGDEDTAEPIDTVEIVENVEIIEKVEIIDTLAAVEAEEDTLPIPKITSNAFRGNNSSATSPARGLATNWDLSSGKNIMWRTAIPRHGYSSPVISGRKVFVTGADDKARELYCFDIYTGEMLWTAQADGIAGSPSSMPSTTADTGLAASTVATNGTQVCAIFATGDIIACDFEGKRLWAKNLGVPDNHYGFASSLLLTGRTLIVQYLNSNQPRIIALDAQSGAQLWAKDTQDKISWSSPILATLGGKSAIVVTSNPAVTAYSLQDGAELWRVECLSGEVGASAACNGGVVYAASEYSKCVAIDGETGEVKWEASDYLPECSSPAATKDLLFVATSYGMVCAYSTETGEIVKEHDFEGDPFYSSPVVADGKVWLFSNSGKAYIFSASDFSLITSFQTGEKTFATPAFSDGMMVVRTDKSIYCVKK